ncbi:hypothetical protein [Flavobacterium tyrosinilyticum]|uniref:hypothetical protein n=1 Tax=Flavobacterium tyrosinilyticum TaxID=1658740 RepID=UPI00202DCAB1|nr:hypothetical protein [Flavobacterium tyrosinilyticum]MCM0667027.1 hypothetical protein [Flavobacterium tyrosinilyticum]
MADTKINYRGKGFWIEESFIELLSEYISKTFETIGLNTFSTNLLQIYNDCDTNRSGESTGMVGILLDRYINNIEDKNNLISIFQQTKTSITDLGSEISINQLNQFEDNKFDPYFASYWSIPVKTQSLLTTIDIMISLLNQTYQGTNTNICYNGYPAIPEATII